MTHRRDKIIAAAQAGLSRGGWKRPNRKASKKKPAHPLESFEQKQVLRWLKAKGYSAFAVPNQSAPSYRGMCGQCVEQAKRNRMIHMTQLKSQGVVPGIPDLCLRELAPKDNRPVLLEMKRERGAPSSNSPIQRQRQKEYQDAGWHVLVALGHKDAITKLMELGF